VNASRLGRNRPTLFDCLSQDFVVWVKVLPLSSTGRHGIRAHKPNLVRDRPGKLRLMAEIVT
jgi:hypothetical protein